MKKGRPLYLMLIFITIIIGILSREVSFIPLFVGDLLWAVMMTFIVFFIKNESNLKSTYAFSLLICYSVEISQLYKGDLIEKIRNTLLGHLVLGKGFLWSDLIAYTGGVVLVALLFQKKEK